MATTNENYTSEQNTLIINWLRKAWPHEGAKIAKVVRAKPRCCLNYYSKKEGEAFRQSQRNLITNGSRMRTKPNKNHNGMR